MQPDWHERALGEIALVERGRFSARPRNDPVYYGGDFPFVQTGDVAGANGRLRTWSQTLNKDGLAVSKLFPRGTILLTIAANIGDVAIAEFPVACPDSVVAVRAKGDIDVDWLAYALSMKKSKLLEAATQNAQKNINLEILRPLKFKVPPLEEQRRIVEVLRTWDEAIEETEALLTTKGEALRWVRNSLLTGKQRLRGFSQAWRKVAIDQVLTEHGLRSNGAEEVYSVSVHLGLVHQIEHLGRSFAAKETAHYNRVLPGDIVYTKSPTGDFPYGIVKQSKLSKDVIVSPLYGVFSPTTRHLGVILDAYFESPIAARNYLHPLVQKGAKNTIAITNQRFLEGTLLLPFDPLEQEALADLIETAKAEIALLKGERESIGRQKRGLMQKLLTGEWRAPVRRSAVAPFVSKLAGASP